MDQFGIGTKFLMDHGADKTKRTKDTLGGRRPWDKANQGGYELLQIYSGDNQLDDDDENSKKALFASNAICDGQAFSPDE